MYIIRLCYQGKKSRDNDREEEGSVETSPLFPAEGKGEVFKIA